MQYLASFYVTKCALRYEKFYLVYISDFPTIGALSFVLFFFGGGGGETSPGRDNPWVYNDNSFKYTITDRILTTLLSLRAIWHFGGVPVGWERATMFLFTTRVRRPFSVFFPRYPNNFPGGGLLGYCSSLILRCFERNSKYTVVTEADSQGTVSHLIY